MKGQQSGWLWAVDYDDGASFATTVQVRNRNILADVALVETGVAGEDWYFSLIGISQVVSDRGVENFPLTGDEVHTIYRTGVTSITFRVNAHQSRTVGRWLINFWS